MIALMKGRLRTRPASTSIVDALVLAVGVQVSHRFLELHADLREGVRRIVSSSAKITESFVQLSLLLHHAIDRLIVLHLKIFRPLADVSECVIEALTEFFHRLLQLLRIVSSSRRTRAELLEAAFIDHIDKILIALRHLFHVHRHIIQALIARCLHPRELACYVVRAHLLRLRGNAEELRDG
jgi:hypothetical protein